MFSMDFKPGRLQNGIKGSEYGYSGTNLSKTPVKIHAIMPSGPPHRICISLRTCKCKILCFGVVIFILMLFILSNIVSYVSTPTYSSTLDKVCKLNEIELQNDIDLEQFEGYWYATYTKGMENKLLAYFLEFYDVKTKFTLKEDGNFDLKSVGGKFMGMWCPIGEGHAEAREPSYPEKLSMFFDTPTGKKFGTKPAWILKTDYTSYAIMYSCWEEFGNGACKPQNTYVVILQRNTAKLPAAKKQEIDQAVRDACVEPKSLRPIQHYGYCPKERENL